MANELLIDVGLTETRVALVEEDRLVHLDLERPDRDSALGAIFLGRVRLIEPGLQAAYIDIGLARDGFLNASDLAPDPDKDAEGDAERPIEQRLAEGDSILVQVIRDPVGEKGVKLTARPSLPGRFMSLTPYDHRVRVSKRINEDAERMRLAAMLQSLLALGENTPVQVSLRLQRKMGERRVGKSAPGSTERRAEDKRKPMGCLVDAAAEKAEQEALATDLQRLRARWIAIEERRSKATAPAELWREMGPVGRALRNHVGAKLDTIRVNDARGFAEARAWLFEHAPELVGKLERYDEPGALFELFEIENDIDSALSRKVVLPSGGALYFGETEALTAIDVDIAKGARRGSDFDELALRINLDAAEEIARQLRLRGIGGIIVIDFLHMDSSAYRAQAVNALRKALARDPAPVKVLGMSALGLVEMTRKRIGESLSIRLFESCPTCDGDGRIPSLPAVQAELIRRAMAEAAMSPRGSRFEIACAPDVAALFDTALLAQLERRLGAHVGVKPDPARKREVFSIDRVN
jgi:ribonuclease G